MHISVHETERELADVASAHIAGLLAAAIAERGSGSIALSGGATPKETLRRLADADLDWSAVSIFQIDERNVALGDPERNASLIERVLIEKVPEANWWPMPIGEADASDRYARLLPARLDVAQLGLGTDGHTASLIPGDPVLSVVDKAVATTGLYKGNVRLTLTTSAINAARHRVWLAVGRSKLAPLMQVVAREDIPASLISQDNCTFFWSF